MHKLGTLWEIFSLWKSFFESSLKEEDIIHKINKKRGDLGERYIWNFQSREKNDGNLINRLK